MSADNGYILRNRADGKFVLQMYFASADEYPPIDDPRAEVFETLQDAILRFQEIEKVFTVEYNLRTEITPMPTTPSPERGTMLATQKFVRKPFEIDAVQVTAENMADVAKWCNGEIQSNAEGQFIKVRVHRAMTERQSQAFATDWVLYAGKGFKVYTDKAFRNSFEQPSDETVLEPTPAPVEELRVTSETV